MPLKNQVHQKILELDPESFLYQLFEYVLDKTFESLDGGADSKNPVSSFGLQKVQMLTDILADQLSGKIPYNNALSALIVLKNRYDTKLNALSGVYQNTDFVSKKKPENSLIRDRKEFVEKNLEEKEAVQHGLGETKDSFAKNDPKNLVKEEGFVEKSIDGFDSKEADSEIVSEKTETKKTILEAHSSQTKPIETNFENTETKLDNAGLDADKLYEGVLDQGDSTEKVSIVQNISQKEIEESHTKEQETGEKENNSAQTFDSQAAGGQTFEFTAKELYTHLQNSLTRPDTPAAVKIVIKDIGVEVLADKILVSLSNTLLLKQITSAKCIDYLKTVWQEKIPTIWQNFDLETFKRAYKDFNWQNTQTASTKGQSQSSIQNSIQNSTPQNLPDQNYTSSQGLELGSDPNQKILNESQDTAEKNLLNSSNSLDGKEPKNNNLPKSETSLSQKIKDRFKNLNKNSTQESQYFSDEQALDSYSHSDTDTDTDTDTNLVYTDSSFEGESFENISSEAEESKKSPYGEQQNYENQTTIKSQNSKAQSPKVQPPKTQNKKNAFIERALQKSGKHFYFVYSPNGESRYNIPDEVEKISEIKDPGDSLDFEDILDDFDLE